MRLAIDVCVGRLTELELWRAGFEVPVRAAESEPDESWLDKAVRLECAAAMTQDWGAARTAWQLGMHGVMLNFGQDPPQRHLAVLEACAALLNRSQRGHHRLFTLLVPGLPIPYPRKQSHR